MTAVNGHNQKPKEYYFPSLYY